MNRKKNTLTRRLATAILGGALLVAAIAPAADAAVPKSGTWRGDMVHQLTGGFEFKSRMVLTEYEGRVVGVVATVRMECGSLTDPFTYGVRDARVVKSWRIGRGPKISRRGSYAFRADGAYFHGMLSRSTVLGGAGATYGDDCRGTGRYNLQRRRG